MPQAAFLESLFLDLLTHRRALRAPTAIEVGGRQVAQALAIASVGVAIDARADLAFEIVRREVIFQ